MKRPLLFSGSEYARRIGLTRQAMDEAGIEVLIVVDPSNMAWLTGYDGWSFYVHQAVILTLEGPPLWWGRPMDAIGAGFTTWLADEAIFSYPDEFVQNPQKHPYKHLSDLLKEKNLDKKRIGLELDNYYFTAACAGQLINELPNASFHEATGLVNWQRIVKSEAELALMRRAALIVERAHQRIVALAKPGMRKSKLIAEIYHSLIDGAEDAEGAFGGDYPAIAPMAPSGVQATAAHLTWDDQPLKVGEATFFEIAGCYQRYHCPQSRTLFFGQPPEEVRKVEAVAVEGLEAAMAAMKPGALAEDIEAAWRKVLVKNGYDKESRIGYSVGLSYPPDWGERTASLRKGDKTELQPGMVFHIIPAMWQSDGAGGGFGLEITETMLVTETGAEPLCTTPRALNICAVD